MAWRGVAPELVCDYLAVLASQDPPPPPAEDLRRGALPTGRVSGWVVCFCRKMDHPACLLSSREELILQTPCLLIPRLRKWWRCRDLHPPPVPTVLLSPARVESVQPHGTIPFLSALPPFLPFISPPSDSRLPG